MLTPIWCLISAYYLKTKILLVFVIRWCIYASDLPYFTNSMCEANIHILTCFYWFTTELLNKVEELEKEKAEKELKSFEIKLDIKPEHHHKIIGHKGGVISKFRTDFDVNIQLPKRDHPEQSTITITGYESNAIKAKDAIMKKIEEYVSTADINYDVYCKLYNI